MAGDTSMERPFEEVIDFREGPGIMARDFRDDGVPLVRLAGLTPGASVVQGCNYLDARDVERRWGQFRLGLGDVLLSTSASLGRIAVVGIEGVGAIPYTGIIRMRPRDDSLHAPFIRYLLEGPDFQEQAEMVGVGSVIRHFGPMHLKQMTVRVPPLREQRVIAHILGTLDDKIELNRRMNKTLEEMARALFKSWFVDFDPVRAKMGGRWRPGESLPGLPAEHYDLFPDRLVPSELWDVPEGWEIVPLSECIDVARGLSYKGSGLSNHGMPMHNLNSIFEGGGYKNEGIKYYDGEYKFRHVVRPGDVIVANTEQGHDRLLIGYAAMVPARYGDSGLFSHHLYRVRPKSASYFTSDFICHLLNTQSMQDVLSGYATGTTVNMLPVDALGITPVVMPSRQIVTAFDSLASAARKRWEGLVGESQALTSTRDTLLPKLVSGEIRVAEAINRGESK